MEKNKKISKFKSSFTYDILKIDELASQIDDAYAYLDSDDYIFDDNESPLYNNVANGIDELIEDMEKLHRYLVEAGIDRDEGKYASAKKSKSKVAKEESWQDEYDHLRDQLYSFIDRGDFAKHGMMVGKTPQGSMQLFVWDVNDANHSDALRFDIFIARDGVKDGWYPVQYIDDREGYIVTVVRTHPTRGDIELTRNERVDGGFRSLSAFIRRYVGEFEAEVEAEANSGLGFREGEDFEDYSFYASTKKSQNTTKSFNSMVQDIRSKNNTKKVM